MACVERGPDVTATRGQRHPASRFCCRWAHRPVAWCGCAATSAPQGGDPGALRRAMRQAGDAPAPQKPALSYSAPPEPRPVESASRDRCTPARRVPGGAAGPGRVLRCQTRRRGLAYLPSRPGGPSPNSAATPARRSGERERQPPGCAAFPLTLRGRAAAAGVGALWRPAGPIDFGSYSW